MRATLVRQWFLCALAVVLLGGFLAGNGWPRATVEAVLHHVSTAWTTAIVLFLMAFSLDTARLWDALRDPQAVIWGAVVNLGFTPLLAWPLAAVQSRHDFALGLMITAIAPCTLATASVFTRRAGGNDAISLLVTLLTNAACVVISPLWLSAVLKSQASLDLTGIIGQLLVCILLPTLLGLLVQIPRPALAFAQRNRGWINIAAQCLVLLLVLLAALRGGMMLRSQESAPAISSLVMMCFACVLVHLASLVLGWSGARWLRISPADTIAVAFAGSQKTLPISLFMATQPVILQADLPLVVFPLLAFHAGQLLLDVMLADRWARRMHAQSLPDPR